MHVVIDYVDKISPYSQQLCYPRICAVNYYVITLSAYIVNYTMLSPYLHSQQLLWVDDFANIMSTLVNDTQVLQQYLE